VSLLGSPTTLSRFVRSSFDSCGIARIDLGIGQTRVQCLLAPPAPRTRPHRADMCCDVLSVISRKKAGET
jgi:hypothetical protein